ncbi:hypothetical protein B9Z35_08190 [Limnohabitans sp. Jir61]|uniref:glycosyltransferase n=1 Tax=Limnohabitans sp. Jir61 TaxID=1826168 RepID=UPI000D3527F3|nr:glycosyltransferase [Limnohabitans sp. Jir61]PUE31006.1 hypothetical protein B9Z35_08190 [Limnohabitans sp. Jir61]
MKNVIFHRIWFGNNDIPDNYENFWLSWQRQFPQCEFRTWTDSDISELNFSKAKIHEMNSLAGKADIARYEILYKYGGIFLDCDMMPLEWFDVSDLSRELVVCNEDENTNYCSIGFIAAPKLHPIFIEMIEHINTIQLNMKEPNFETGPWLFGEFLKKHKHIRKNTATFYPYSYNEPSSKLTNLDLSNTWGVHTWGSSWVSTDKITEKAHELIKRGDIEDALSMLEIVNTDNKKLIIEKIEDIKKLRKDFLSYQQKWGNSHLLETANLLPFDLIKLIFYFLQKKSNPTIWQIGAADGILVDPIRPALINFDPICTLLEPNPYLFEKLKESYKNNKNCTLLNKSFGVEDSTLKMNCINPSKVEALGLPNWVNGISSAFDNKNAIGGKTITHELKEKINQCIEIIETETINISKLLEINNYTGPNILVIDAEGMDFTIINKFFGFENITRHNPF